MRKGRKAGREGKRKEGGREEREEGRREGVCFSCLKRDADDWILF